MYNYSDNSLMNGKKCSDRTEHHQRATRICCASQAIHLWPHIHRQRVQAGEVRDTGESGWETTAWKTKYIIIVLRREK